MSLRFKMPEGLHAPTSMPSIGWPRKRSQVRLESCLNCGEQLTGKFCSNCGQEAVDHRTAVWPLVSDALGEFLRWDSKIVHTLVPLLFRPGYLTNEYNAGKRVKYLSPFRMYLTVSVIFFIVAFSHPRQMFNFVSTTTTSSSHPGITITTDHKSLQTGLKQAQSAIGNATKEATSEGDSTALPALKAASSAVGFAAAAQKASTAATPAKAKPADPYANIPKLYPNIDGTSHFGSDTIRINELPKTYAMYMKLQADPHYPYKNGPFVQHLMEHFYANFSDINVFRESVQNLIPKAGFLMLPIFALLLYGFYWRSRRYYVEHLVFALHNHTFVFIVGAIDIYANDIVKAVLTVALFTYLYVSMLMVYKQHWFKTLVKFWLIGSIYSMLLLFGLVLTAIVAFFLPVGWHW